MRDLENENKRPVQKYVRIEVSIPFALLSMFDEESERRGYNRSEALRHAMRNEIEKWTGRQL